MNSDFYEVIGSQSERPKEIDVSSSEFYVYERKDIQKYEEKDEQQNVIFKGWKYLERKVPKDKWAFEVSAENKQNLDIILLALPDIYETLINLGGI